MKVNYISCWSTQHELWLLKHMPHGLEHVVAYTIVEWNCIFYIARRWKPHSTIHVYTNHSDMPGAATHISFCSNQFQGFSSSKFTLDLVLIIYILILEPGLCGHSASRWKLLPGHPPTLLSHLGFLISLWSKHPHDDHSWGRTCLGEWTWSCVRFSCSIEDSHSWKNKYVFIKYTLKLFGLTVE